MTTLDNLAAVQFLRHPAAGCRPDYMNQRCKGKGSEAC
jgi:hypothetical protein